MREVEARRERALENRAIGSYRDVPSMGLNEDFVLGRSHTSD
jgi:hypothetical protein